MAVRQEKSIIRAEVEFLLVNFALGVAYDLLTLGQVKSRGWVK